MILHVNHSVITTLDLLILCWLFFLVPSDNLICLLSTWNHLDCCHRLDHVDHLLRHYDYGFDFSSLVDDFYDETYGDVSFFDDDHRDPSIQQVHRLSSHFRWLQYHQHRPLQYNLVVGTKIKSKRDKIGYNLHWINRTVNNASSIQNIFMILLLTLKHLTKNHISCLVNHRTVLCLIIN